MVRTRFVLLVTIAALVAPWIAPCLTAPVRGHAAMPCCRAGNHAPVVRPCCGAAGDETPVAPGSDASRMQPAQTIALVVAPVAYASTSARTNPHPAAGPTIVSRLRSTVLLI